MYQPVIGITSRAEIEGRVPMASTNPPSYGVYKGAYAADPAVLLDGRLVVSWAADVGQDYGLYVIDADGGNRSLLYDQLGTTELRTRVIAHRTRPPILADGHLVASALPPTREGPYDKDGVFTFDARNVYFNAPVDSPIVSAPRVGSAASIRFFADLQKDQSGSIETIDWPILLREMPVDRDGSVINTQAPANVPLFEQLRDKDGKVPLTGLPIARRGAAHVAGLNFGRPGHTESCVGCHTGHSMIPVPEIRDQARWTNLAPGATVKVSSVFINHDAQAPELIDRLANATEGAHKAWFSAIGVPAVGQWVQLTFPVPIKVRTVRPYNPRLDTSESSVQVQSVTVTLYADAAATRAVATQVSGPLKTLGTDVGFADVVARAVRIRINSSTGTASGHSVAGLSEVEVIANADAGLRPQPTRTPHRRLVRPTISPPPP